MIETEMYRARALQSERRARAASDRQIKAEWEALAIEWHSLANAIAQGPSDIEQIDLA
jgi:cell division protein FtsL